MRSDRNEGDFRVDDGATTPEARTESGGEAARDAGPSATPESNAENPSVQLEAARKELEELRDRHLRVVAEFDNFRKRTERERSEAWARAQGQLVEKLLEAVDDLERVADYTEETTSVSALLAGVQMVERKLLRALETAGLERLDAHGVPFDPQEHEALMTSATEHPHEDETVGEVFQKGYRFQGHLLRPARVTVRKHEG